MYLLEAINVVLQGRSVQYMCGKFITKMYMEHGKLQLVSYKDSPAETTHTLENTFYEIDLFANWEVIKPDSLSSDKILEVI